MKNSKDNMSKQITIGSFKRDSNVAKKVFNVLGKILGYLLGAIFTILLVLLITGIIVGSAFAIYVSNNIDPTIDENLLFTVTEGQTTKLYYYEFTDRKNRIGTPIELVDQRIYGTENSLWASIDEIPDDLENAFIAIEDKRFRTHNGVDWKRTGGAALNFFIGFDDTSYGGSTITQQLIKNVTGRDDATIQRKVQEILCALNLEKSMEKDQILELYLNIVPLSHSCIGVRAAAQTYFGKELNELTLTECAALAAITKYPTKYDPIQNPDNNKKRRQDVLYEMRNQNLITEEEYLAAIDEDLVLNVNGNSEEEEIDSSKVNSWYIDTVITDVRDDLMEKYNISSTMASNMINSGGLNIYILMDPKVQEVMEEVYLDDSNFPANRGGIPAESAMAIVDPYTGDLLGVVGARGEKRGNLILNYATQTQRAPGSSIKPIAVYGPALEEGVINYGSVYDDTPLWFNGGTPYPHNYPNQYRGLTTINSAIERSVNTVAMKVLEDLTIETSFDYMKNRLGFDYLIDYAETSDGRSYTDKGLAALSLGQLNYGVTVRDMAAAYTVFPSGGIYNEGKSYLKVTDSAGNVILSNEDNNGNIVFSEETSYIMTKMMQNVINRGTGTDVSLRHKLDVAGKTGTAGNDYDRWFVGYTPYYVGAVWYGYSYPKSLNNIQPNPSTIIFDIVMTRLHEEIIADAKENGEPLKSFEDNKPADIIRVTYCRDSGKLMGEACYNDIRGSRAETGYFSSYNRPMEYCDVHVMVDYDSANNTIATAETAPENLTRVALIRVDDRTDPKLSRIYIWDRAYVYHASAITTPVTPSTEENPATTEETTVSTEVSDTPIATEPVATETTDPVVTEPVVTTENIVVTEPIVTEPVATEPAVTEPPVTETTAPAPVTEPIAETTAES